MVGQAPFVGYTVADFAAGPDLEVSVDTSLLETTEEPEWFIAIASERKVAIDAFMVVELRLADVRGALGAAATAPPVSVDDKVALAEAQTKVAVLTAELEKHEGRLKDVDMRAGDAHVRAERLTHQIRDMDEELRRQRDRATKLTKQLDDEKKARTKAEVELGLSRGRTDVPGAKERIEQLAAELSEARSRISDLEEQNTRLSTTGREPDAAITARISELEAALARAEAQRATVARRAEALEEALTDTIRGRDDLAEKNIALEKRAAELTRERETISEALIAEQNALEERLRERGHRIASLERELREGLRVGRELLAALEAREEERPGGTTGGTDGAAPPAPPANGPTEVARAQLDTLAARAARAEADLKAAEWRIAQLEQTLLAEERGYLEPETVELQLEQALLAAQQEIAELRRAAGPEGSHVVRGVIEQSVLLHQVASQSNGHQP